MMSARQTYDELAAAWRALRVRGVAVREVACVGAPRTSRNAGSIPSRAAISRYAWWALNG